MIDQIVIELICAVVPTVIVCGILVLMDDLNK
jgi:hypothetical protein